MRALLPCKYNCLVKLNYAENFSHGASSLGWSLSWSLVKILHCFRKFFQNSSLNEKLYWMINKKFHLFVKWKKKYHVLGALHSIRIQWPTFGFAGALKRIENIYLHVFEKPDTIIFWSYEIFDLWSNQIACPTLKVKLWC